MGLDFSRNAAEISDELNHGAVAQLGERGLCKPEVRGSIPLSSTMSSSPGAMNAAPAPGNSHPIHRLSRFLNPHSHPIHRLSRESGNPVAGDSIGSPVKPGMTSFGLSMSGAKEFSGCHWVHRAP